MDRVGSGSIRAENFAIASTATASPRVFRRNVGEGRAMV